MLDYDGTLAPFRPERDKAAPYPGVRGALERMMTPGHTRVVIVTGRAPRDVLGLLGMWPPPEIWGSHGWERRTAEGACEAFALPEGAQAGIDEAQARITEAGLGEHCETKPASVALHWRGLSAASVADLRSQGQALWGPLAAAHGLEVMSFDGGLELRVPGRDKGTAVRQLIAESPDRVVAAYLGDDLTDEDAFLAMPAGGLGILVRPELRSTAAGAWIKPPEGLLEFLARWSDTVEERW